MQPRILVISNCYPNPYKAHACVFVKRHVLLHRRAGLNVQVLAVEDSRQGKYHSTRKYLRLLGAILVATLRGEYDLVHAHWPFPAAALALIPATIRRKPLVTTSHGAYVDSYQDRAGIIKWWIRLALRKSRYVIAVGEEHRQTVMRISGVPYERTRVIDMGIWQEEPPPSQAEARQRLDIDPAQPIILYIGDLLHHKGPDIPVQAAARLRDKGRSFSLLVGGQGPEAENLRRQIDALGLADICRLLGPIPADDVFTWFAAADICVVPSRSEAFGLVAVEAMYAGAPVIAADVGGLRQTVRHGENGFLFPREDDAALANRLAELLDDPGLRQQFAQAGRQIAALYDMRKRAESVADLYRQCIDEDKSATVRGAADALSGKKSAG
jgi:glycosyltransferase involved in cell wall biosynthesis